MLISSTIAADVVVGYGVQLVEKRMRDAGHAANLPDRLRHRHAALDPLRQRRAITSLMCRLHLLGEGRPRPPDSVGDLTASAPRDLVVVCDRDCAQPALGRALETGSAGVVQPRVIGGAYESGGDAESRPRRRAVHFGDGCCPVSGGTRPRPRPNLSPGPPLAGTLRGSTPRRSRRPAPSRHSLSTSVSTSLPEPRAARARPPLLARGRAGDRRRRARCLAQCVPRLWAHPPQVKHSDTARRDRGSRGAQPGAGAAVAGSRVGPSNQITPSQVGSGSLRRAAAAAGGHPVLLGAVHDSHPAEPRAPGWLGHAWVDQPAWPGKRWRSSPAALVAGRAARRSSNAKKTFSRALRPTWVQGRAHQRFRSRRSAAPEPRAHGQSASQQARAPRSIQPERRGWWWSSSGVLGSFPRQVLRLGLPCCCGSAGGCIAVVHGSRDLTRDGPRGTQPPRPAG